jgi:hypothetical protein
LRDLVVGDLAVGERIIALNIQITCLDRYKRATPASNVVLPGKIAKIAVSLSSPQSKLVRLCFEERETISNGILLSKLPLVPLGGTPQGPARLGRSAERRQELVAISVRKLEHLLLCKNFTG